MKNKPAKKHMIGFKMHDEDDDEEWDEEGEETAQVGYAEALGGEEEEYEDGGMEIDLEALKEALGLNVAQPMLPSPTINITTNVGAKRGCKKCKCKKCKKRRKHS